MVKITGGAVCLLAAASMTRCAAEEYANNVVVDAAELSRRLASGSGDTVVFDVRSKLAYDAGHVPGAYRHDAAVWKIAFDSNHTAKIWGRGFGEHGIGPNTKVVVYDETLTPAAARVWWLLRYWGVEQAAVLNGGWLAWQAAGGIGNTTVPSPVDNPLPFQAGPRSERTVGREALQLLIDEGKAPALIDTRSLREHSAGCLPGAKRLDWVELVDARSGSLLPPDELRAKFAAAGIDPAGPTISYCRTGGRASVAILALAALGTDDAVSYYGGWSDWSAPREVPETVR